MKTIIYYFSGTGNSLWLADRLCEQIKKINSNESVRTAAVDNKTKFDLSADAVGFVFPVHLWRAPKIVEKFAAGIPQRPNVYFFAVADYKSDLGDCAAAFEKTLKKENKLSAFFDIPMPGNNIIYYSVETEEQRKKKIENAEKALSEAAEIIANRGKKAPKSAGISAKIKSGITSGALTKTFAASDKNFYVTDKCKGCGVCEKVCPVGNIRKKDGKPQWQHGCLQCVACINACPSAAIEYGKTTAGKVRYINEYEGIEALLESRKPSEK